MADDPVLERALLINEPDFRLVRLDLVDGHRQYALEVRDGQDAMGVEKWRAFETRGSKSLEALFKYLIRIADKESR